MPPPKTSYAQRGEINIAYQVVGDGPVDLVLINGLASHMDLWWVEPEATAMLRRLGSFARLILFDKPGTGLSDPVTGQPTIEERAADVEVVMDAVGSERAVLLGYSEGGLPAAHFAATYPDRTQALIVLSSGARMVREPDPEYEFNEEVAQAWAAIDETAYTHWGEGKFVLLSAPSWRASPAHRNLVEIFERASASPGMVKACLDGMREHYDVRAILPAIRVPTLVLHARDEFIPIALGRDLAARIPDSRFVELPGADHIPFARDWRPVVAEIEEFVTGHHGESEPDRVLKTVLFTDIVRATERAAELGDHSWRALLERHDRVVHEQLSRFGGRAVKSLGDGHLAAFEGAGRAVRCARAICAEATELGIEVRAGLHSGECEAIGEDLGGLAVHIGARVGALATPSEVLVSRTVCDLVVGSGLEFSSRGAHELKGVPGTWDLYAATGDARAGARAVASAGPDAQQTPGPAESMKPIDRFVLRVARHAPSLPRAGFRLARLGRRRG